MDGDSPDLTAAFLRFVKQIKQICCWTMRMLTLGVLGKEGKGSWDAQGLESRRYAVPDGELW